MALSQERSGCWICGAICRYQIANGGFVRPEFPQPNEPSLLVSKRCLPRSHGLKEISYKLQAPGFAMGELIA